MKPRTAGLILAGIIGAMLLVSLVGGKDGFDGTFVGEAMGQEAVAELADDRGALSGVIRYAGFTAQVKGKVDGEKANGTVSAQGMAAALEFEATLEDDDTLQWRYPQLQASFTLRRKDDGGGATRASGGGARDGRLVGRWRRTASGRTGSGANRLIVSTDVYCTLAADGSFVYGGATGGAVGPGHWPGVMVGPAGTTRGQWKTEGATLLTRAEGTEQWLPVGRYSVSGSGLVLYPAGGGQPTYWERQ